MKTRLPVVLAALLCLLLVTSWGVCDDQPAVALPDGVKAVWDMSTACHETTPTRQRICINGLWRWQPVKQKSDQPPTDNWGYFKVPGPWPKTTWKRAAESQAHYPHPSWKDVDLSAVQWAWYQREVEVPKDWAGRRIVVEAQYVNTSAVVYVDGKRAGEIKSRGGRVDLGALCQPGAKHVLSILVNKPRGGADFRGLCGDVYLDGVPQGPRIDDVKIDTSVRQWQIAADSALASLDPNEQYTLGGDILDADKVVKTIASRPFRAADLQSGRITFANPWKPDKLWDTITPQNKYDLKLRLKDSSGKVLDEFLKLRFGFREFWVDGRDFRLNGTRFYCFAAPLDVGEVSAYAASYEGASKMISRFRGVGINIAYTHNYSSAPGAHVSFEEIMRAADDMGLLISFSQPEFTSYKWDTAEADRTNGYAEDAEIHVRQVQNHPSVVMYTTNHNSTGYAEDQNPDHIDGIFNPFPSPQDKLNRTDARAIQALRAVAIVEQFDKSRPIYNHSSGNLGQMYTLNCYLDFVPMQERSDWFGHWATDGIKPLLLVEYGEPYLMTWSNQRGARATTAVQWFPMEWGAQFRGDAAYRLAEGEKPHRATELDRKAHIPRESENMGGIQAAYIARTWPAYRTWGVSLFNKWEIYTGWHPRPGAVNPTCKVDWNDLQKPGFSGDFVTASYDDTPRWDLCYQPSDWIPNLVGKALLRYNRPLLAYIAGKPANFTSRDHNFNAGETVEKQVIVINNSRQTVACDCTWLFRLRGVNEVRTNGERVVYEGALTITEGKSNVTVETGEKGFAPIRFTLPKDLTPRKYELTMTVKFDTGETQEDTFAINVLPPAPKPVVAAKVAVFDPDGDTKKLLTELGVKFESVDATADTSAYDILVIGKHALTLANPKLNLARVRDGLKVIVFEQTTEVLERRLGFRTQEYGLRDVFLRLAGHPVMAGVTTENLHDWRGEGTTVPPRLDAPMNDQKQKYPEIKWCGFTAPRAWRCGCQGTVATVLIEKPAAGDFLPILDGGFAMQYAPLLEYREGSGMVVFCQLDVTGRTESDPAATRLVGNLLGYVSAWKPAPSRKLLYVGQPAGKAHLESAKFAPADYQGGALTADQVLVAGPGAGEKLAANAKEIQSWLKAGGRLLAIGLEQEEVNAILPSKITMKKAEYACGSYSLPAADSPFAGVAPADLYNRMPRELSLVSGGAATFGDGVLAKAENADVVFCQLAPWQYDYAKDYFLKPTFRRFSFTLSRLLANMGVTAKTPLLENMEEPLAAKANDQGEVGGVKGSSSKQRDAGSTRWLSGLYLDKPEALDDPYRYYRW